MKKIAFFLIACLTCMQSTYAATSALTESLLEYEAITTAIGTDPNFQNIISQNEFIIDIKRITHQVDITGIVKYDILTRVISAPGNVVASMEQEAIEMHSSGSHKHKHHHHTNSYIATLEVSPNPGIGPNIVTVLSITQVRSQRSTFFNTDFSGTEE